jgi:hypothetical protein
MCIEVAIAWGSTTLHVAHVPTSKRPSSSRFVLSDELPPGARGFAVPRGPLITPGGELLVDHGDASDHTLGIAVVVPVAARATFVDRGKVFSREEALRRGIVESDEVLGALLFPLARGRRCRFSAGELEVEVGAVEREEAIGKPAVAFRRSHWAILAVAAMLHAIVLAAIVALPSVH